MILRPLMHGEERLVASLLADASLPVEDLQEGSVAFIVAIDGADAIGAIGLEVFGDVGLLRSLVVRPDARGLGIGGQLVDALEAQARQRGLHRLVLLTQTAAPFFAGRAYHVIDRHAAPASVQASAQFRSLCPASATCMTRQLDRAHP
jgi:amino-acid N-acetyltransferase